MLLQALASMPEDFFLARDDDVLRWHQRCVRIIMRGVQQLW